MRHVCVVGAGVIGVTSAWALAEAGWRVQLIDRTGATALGTSYCNGGQLSYRYVSPLADAGVPLKALKWLLQPDGPLRVRPQVDLAQWRWLAQFLARCHGRANREMTARLVQLGEYSRRCLAELMALQPLREFGWREAGKLVVHRDAASFARAARAAGESNERRALTPAECLEIEPAMAALAPQVHGGILDRREAVADCHEFCKSLLERLEVHPNFAGLQDDEVLAIVPDGATRVALRTRTGRRGADAVVIANGIASRSLLLAAGRRVPLYPLKGYSLDLPIAEYHVAPRLSITDFERKVLYARLGHRLRVAAMVDLAGEDSSIDPRRLASLMRIVQQDMPNAGDFANAAPWAGLRPATPDGAPLIGRGHLPGLWLNIGHGGLGFTFACGSANVLARQMTAGRHSSPAPDFDWPSP